MTVDVGRRSHADVRRHTIAAVLGAVHSERTLTRAELTQRTGLSRSSIATVIADLEAAGLVRQRPSTPTARVGRPSPAVEPTDAVLTAAVNPDVDGVRVALFGLGGRIVATSHERVTGIVTPTEAATAVVRALDDLGSRFPSSVVVGVCAAIPGWVDGAGRMVEHAPHLRWRQVPFADMLTTATGIPSVLSYDAVAGLAAERQWGVASTSTDAVYLYGGPGGIGAAAMVDGRILRGSRGHAARLGHVLVAPDGPVCGCGNVGCLTSVVSAHTLAAAVGAPSTDAADLQEAFEQHPATAALERHTHDIATALRMLTHAYDPELVIMGGFFGTFLRHRRSTLETALGTGASAGQGPRLVEPGLGTDQILTGAGHLAFGPLLDNPLGFVWTPSGG